MAKIFIIREEYSIWYVLENFQSVEKIVFVIGEQSIKTKLKDD